MDKFDIFFSGRTRPDADPDGVRAGVGKLFKLEGRALDALFSGRQVRVKIGVDVDTAGRYRAAFRDVGALVDIVPSGQTPPAQRARPTTAPPSPAAATDTERTAADGGLELLPAHTGSLEDCAPQPAPRQLPDISGIGLAEPGITLDETPPAEPVREYDLTGYSIAPANSGSLDDGAIDKPRRPIGDISHLELESIDGEDGADQ